MILTPTPTWGTGKRGIFSFTKENIPLLNPQEKGIRLAVSDLNGSYASGMGMPARGGAALALRYELPLLLLSAATLPILKKYRLISFYRQSSQCGERSNAAISQAVCRRATVTRVSR